MFKKIKVICIYQNSIDRSKFMGKFQYRGANIVNQ